MLVRACVHAEPVAWSYMEFSNVLMRAWPPNWLCGVLYRYLCGSLLGIPPVSVPVCNETPAAACWRVLAHNTLADDSLGHLPQHALYSMLPAAYHAHGCILLYM